MTRRLLSMFCALALCLSLLPATALAAEGTLTYQYYNIESGQMTEGTYTGEYTSLSDSISKATTWNAGWYVVSGTVNVNSNRDSTITVSGTVNLILPAGSNLNLSYGIISISDGGTLNIYGQAGGSGTLTVKPYSTNSAGISLDSASALNIHGGKVNATGYTNSATKSAPGIDVGGSGTLTVYGGEVTAEAGTYNGAGIRVTSSGIVSIYGGTVTATGASNKSANGYSGAGIGGNGSNGGSSAGETCGTVNIYGGTVTATGGSGGSGASAGIGGGQGGTISNQGGGGTVTITGGTVTAIGGESTADNAQAPGIGGAVYNNKGNAGSFSTGTGGSAVITTTGGIQAGTSGCSAIIDNKVYGNVTLPDSLKTLNKHLTVPSGATLILPDGTTTKGTITVASGGTLTVSGTVTNTGTITVESGGTLTGTGTIHNTSSGTVTGDGTINAKVTYPSTVTVTSDKDGNTAAPGTQVEFTATVSGTAGTPTGTVTFKDGDASLGSEELDDTGKATYTVSTDALGVGSHTITAVYTPAEGSSYTEKTSSALTFRVVGDVTGITVTSQPTKTEYKTGDALDLTGLTITVSYEGGASTTVTWGEGSGITSDPENGTELSTSQHNGKAVTITYEGQSAQTSVLSVSKANQTGFAFTEESPKEVDYSPNGTFTVKAEGGEGTGAVTYTVTSGEDVISIDGNTATILKAGTATITATKEADVDYNEATDTLTVTVSKADPTVTVTPVSGLTYTGQAQALIKAGTTTGGTLVYSLTGGNDYTAEIPTGTAVGSYTVWYKVLGNENYNDTQPASVSVTIGKVAATVTKAPETVTGLTYDGQAQALVTEGTADGGDMMYRLGNSGDFSEQIPTGTNAGDYSVWYKVVGDENHSDTDPVEVKITIAKATPAYTVPTGLTATYGDTLADVALPDDWSWNDPDTTSVGNVGNNTFSATYTPSDTTNYNTVTKNLAVTVSAKNITGAEITLGDVLTYTGQQQTQQITSVTVDGLDVTYTVTGNTGTDADSYTLTVTGTGNFTGTATKEWTIAKANYNGTTDVSGTLLANWPDKVTLPDIPAGASYGAASYDGSDGAVKDLSIEGGVLSYTGGESITVDQAYKITVQVDGGKNYEDYTITVTLTGTDKKVPTGAPTLSTTTITYGQSLSTIALSGSMQDGAETVTGTFTWDAPTTTPDAGSYEAHWTFTPADGNLYVSVSGTTTITVNKATPTGTPKYTAITTSGKTLADAGLTTEGGTFSVPGTVAWGQADTTQVQANTAYTWKFTPTDSDNYNSISGSVTLYTVSSGGGGGGGSSSNITTETTKKPDGSTTTTVTNKNTGTVTETTTWPDGSKEVIETKKDGTVTTTTTDTTGNKTQVVENTDGSSKTTVDNKDGSGSVTVVDENGQVVSEATLSKSAVAAAQEKGEAVTLPMPEVPITTDRETAPTVTVDLPSGTSAKVEIPVADVTAGTVAVLVKANGNEEVVKTSVTTENGVAVTLNDGDTVKIVDNSKDFADVPDNYWAAEAVDFAVSRELFAGTSATTFSPNTAMTRAMIVTVLARFEGVDTTTGSTWYEAGQQWAMENGVSDGTNMDASLTREQLATMLWRYAGSPSVSDNLSGYTDADTVSSYAQQAMAWCVEHGIIGGTTTTTLSPQGQASRAQVATILMRFLEANQ